MMRMLLDDINLFVDPKKSHYPGTNEHIILNRPVITEPVRTLFNLD